MDTPKTSPVAQRDMPTDTRSPTPADGPPPKADDALPGPPAGPALYRARRERVIDALRAHGGGVAIVRTAPIAIRNRDTEYPYRHDSAFFYLSGFTEPHAWLVIRADAAQSFTTLFCLPRDIERETWDGVRYGPQRAQQLFGVDAAYSVDELDARMPALLANAHTLHYARDTSPELDEAVQRWREVSKGGSGRTLPAHQVDLSILLDEMRLIKDTHELYTMRRAASISARAHLQAMRACKPGVREYELEAQLLYAFRRHGAQAPAYGSIVAAGANACVLHYPAGNALVRDGDLVLIDAGCELDGYASDITRTFPANGRFTAAQRDLYDVVLAAQQAAIDATRAGVPFDVPHDAAVRVLAQGMLDLKLLDAAVHGTLDDVIASRAYTRFYMHRTGHWIGLDVHDCGDYQEPDPDPDSQNSNTACPNTARPNARCAHAACPDATSLDTQHAGSLARDTTERDVPRPWRRLRANMTLTIEPGLYVRAAPDVPRAYWNTGIRIEDDAIVTPHGCELMTREVPAHADDIEAWMRDTPARA
ncbi:MULTISPECIES: aminopeptidase P N-terminal domain-containing protein [Burkholderiaceae]|uniref:aminopeptidase P N-terminal domain-containing protein n=2 Tax=Burkholderiales TaxID=80840 RepID=UPI0009619D4F|nr:aminopeptidase P N-terminal domain-containing protein [Burkholderia sp. b13]SIT72345.1 aminopeptidase P Metallo peptidase. MEROPS family M24B [Burkholderia sp. b13]